MATNNPDRHCVDPKTGCWNWTGSVFHSGYGQWSTGGLAHRKMYELHRGRIPDGLSLDHLCRNRRCVNPDHLEPVSGAVNAQRGLRAKLSPDAVNELRQRAAGGERVARLAAEYGIERGYAYRVVNGQRWANVTPTGQRPNHRNPIPPAIVSAVLADARAGLSSRQLGAKHGIGKTAAWKIATGRLGYDRDQ